MLDRVDALFIVEKDGIMLAERLVEDINRSRPDLVIKFRNARSSMPIGPDDTALAILVLTASLFDDALIEDLGTKLRRVVRDHRLVILNTGIDWLPWDFAAEMINVSRLDIESETTVARWLTNKIVISTDYAPTPIILDARTIMPTLLQKVESLPLGRKTKDIFYSENITYIGDLVIRTESDLLRLQLFDLDEIYEIRKILDGLGLQLGSHIPDWPPANIESALHDIDVARRAAELQQGIGGATFEVRDDQLAIQNGNPGDEEAAKGEMTQQMQSVIREKATSFASIAARLDNQVGWTGIGRASDRLVKLLSHLPDEIPSLLGYLYPIAIEFGTFIEMDNRLLQGSVSNAIPLDAEVRRPLNDLVRNLAPWLRSFPSVRQADDDAAQFLARAADLGPAIRVAEIASSARLISEQDLEVFRTLKDAADRGEFQGEKAAGRAQGSANNLVITSVKIAGSFMLGAIASGYSVDSPIVHRVANFLVSGEKAIEQLVAELPYDLRFSITDMLRDAPSLPSAPPAPIEISPDTDGLRPSRRRETR